jgi:hypothetical protein
MPAVSTLSNPFKFPLLSGNIDFDADTFKIILMDASFAFDRDSHATLADVTAHQLSTAHGYTQNDETLTNVSVNEDDAGDRGVVTWDNVLWTASGGDIGPAGAAVIYDDATADDTVAGCIDFGADYTIPDGSSLQIQDIELDLA